MRLLRMVRIGRLFRKQILPDVFYNALEEVVRPEVLPIAAHVLKIIIFFGWLNHIIACLWYNVGKNSSGAGSWMQELELEHGMDGESLEYMYLAAYHWSLQNYQGSAGVLPWNFTERLVAVII